MNILHHTRPEVLGKCPSVRFDRWHNAHAQLITKRTKLCRMGISSVDHLEVKEGAYYSSVREIGEMGEVRWPFYILHRSS